MEAAEGLRKGVNQEAMAVGKGREVDSIAGHPGSEPSSPGCWRKATCHPLAAACFPIRAASRQAAPSYSFGPSEGQSELAGAAQWEWPTGACARLSLDAERLWGPWDLCPKPVAPGCPLCCRRRTQGPPT